MAEVGYQHPLVLLKRRRVNIANDTVADGDIGWVLSDINILSPVNVNPAAVENSNVVKDDIGGIRN